MKSNLLTLPVSSFSKRSSRERLYKFKATYAHLYNLLEGYLDGDYRTCRELTIGQNHQWCVAAGLDVVRHAALAQWFQGLLLHIGINARTLISESQIIQETDAWRMPKYQHPTVSPAALLRQAQLLSDWHHLMFMLTGDRNNVSTTIDFDRCGIYVRNLINALATVELQRHNNLALHPQRGEGSESWFDRVEQSLGMTRSRPQRDKAFTLPRKGARAA